jgi:hypothetical protein
MTARAAGRKENGVGDYLDEYLRDYSAWHFGLLGLLLFLGCSRCGASSERPGIRLSSRSSRFFPAVGLILLWWLAFSRWPIKRDEPVSAKSNSSRW